MSEPRKVRTYQLVPAAQAADAAAMQAKGLEKLGVAFDVVEGSLNVTVQEPGASGGAYLPGYSIVEFEALVTDKEPT